MALDFQGVTKTKKIVFISLLKAIGSSPPAPGIFSVLVRVLQSLLSELARRHAEVLAHILSKEREGGEV